MKRDKNWGWFEANLLFWRMQVDEKYQCNIIKWVPFWCPQRVSFYALGIEIGSCHQRERIKRKCICIWAYRNRTRTVAWSFALFPHCTTLVKKTTSRNDFASCDVTLSFLATSFQTFSFDFSVLHDVLIFYTFIISCMIGVIWKSWIFFTFLKKVNVLASFSQCITLRERS